MLCLAADRCNLLWSFATCGQQAPQVFERAAPTIVERLGEYAPQGIANVLWAYATLGYDSPLLFNATAKHAVWRLRDFNQQELSLTVWAYATLGLDAPQLFDALAEEVVTRVHELNPQAVSNIAWAFASRGHAAPQLLASLSRKLRAEADDFHAQGIAIMLWSLATADINCSAAFLDYVADVATRRMQEFNQQGLSNLVWAYAAFGQPAPQLYAAVAARSSEEEMLRTFSSQGLSNMLYAYAKQMYLSDSALTLFKRITPLVVAAASNMSTQSFVGAVWSCAVLGFDETELFLPMAGIARARIAEFNAQGLANLGWAFAVADLHGAEVDRLFGDGVFARKCQELIGDEEAYSAPGSNAFEHLRQLHQWELWRQAMNQQAERRGVSEWPPLNHGLREACSVAFASHRGRPSDLQRQVYATLEELGFELAEEVISSDGYSIDMVINGREEEEEEGSSQRSGDPRLAERGSSSSGGGTFSRGSGDSSEGGSEEEKESEDWGVASDDWGVVAVEVDGPTHFLYRSSMPTGATNLKRRQLRQRGWKLVSVPYFEWRGATRMARSLEERQALRKEYILRKMRQEIDLFH